MTREQLIREVAARTNFLKTDCEKIVKETFDVIIDELEAHGSVKIPNLGVFRVITRKGRKFRIPSTGEEHKVPDRKYPKFIPAELLKEKVK